MCNDNEVMYLNQLPYYDTHITFQTSLCNTALDNPMHKTRDTLIAGIIHFMETDTVRYMYM